MIYVVWQDIMNILGDDDDGFVFRWL